MQSANRTEKESTKDQILAAALTLFAEKGYDGVGVDEIGAAVGMKRPSLYKHFRGKEAILDALIARMTLYYEERFGSADQEAAYPETLEALAEESLRRARLTMQDEQIRKVRKMLMMEQFRNEKLRKLTTLHHLTAVCAMNEAFLERLMQNGKVRRCDPKLLAFEYTAPVTLLVQLADREPERMDEALEMARQHLAHFSRTYGI